MRSQLFVSLLKLNLTLFGLAKIGVICVSVFWISTIVIALVASPVQAKEINQLKTNIATKPTITSTQTILVFGDSLSAGYGIQQAQSWPALLEQKLAQNKTNKFLYKVVNVSISGETTSGGLARFSAALATHKPNIVIIELGANDGLRGLAIAEMQTNLSKMIVQAKIANAKVLLVGMKIPPNYGLKYSKNFSAAYTDLAKQHNIALVPFLLESVAGKPELVQADGLHPLAVAQPKLLENVRLKLETLLNE